MIKLTEEQIIDGQNEAYLKAGHNAYFGNGFNAGVEFALKQINKLPTHSVTCSLCTKKDKMYSFKVRDYVNEIVGRKNEEGGFFYIQRGDGAVHKYDADRVTQYTELNYR